MKSNLKTIGRSVFRWALAILSAYCCSVAVHTEGDSAVLYLSDGTQQILTPARTETYNGEHYRIFDIDRITAFSLWRFV